MIYREDESRIREPNLRENFAWLNRFTLSLLKQHPDDKQSTVMKVAVAVGTTSSCRKSLQGPHLSCSRWPWVPISM